MRERLGVHFRETHCFTAIFQRFGTTVDGSHTACLMHLRIDGRWVADHVWIHRSKAMKLLEPQYGDVVQFEARVGRYAKGEPLNHVSEVEYDFTVEKIRNFVILTRKEGVCDNEPGLFD